MNFNTLKVSKEQLLELFPDCDAEIFFRDPINDLEFEERYLPNKLWRLNNLYTIVDKQGERRPFIMNLSQLRVYAKSLIHPRLLILKSRQQGISTFWLISYHDDALFIADLSVGLMAQGRDEAGTLLTRTKFAWNNLDLVVKEELGQSLVKDNADEIGLSNESTIFIRTSFRSATLHRLHISEYGKICNKFPERAKETKTGTLQAVAPGNNVVVESTAEGVNDFKYMWDKDYGKDPYNLGPKEFLCVFLPWWDDPDCNFDINRVPTKEQADYFKELELAIGRKLTQRQKNFWIDQYDELGEAIYQEYPGTPEEAFKAMREGTYYAKQFKKYVKDKGRVLKGLYDKNLPVEVFMDLGMNDTFVLGYVQLWDDQYRLVKEYRNNGEGLAHYVAHMKETGYNIASIYGPHDLEVRELGAGTDVGEVGIGCSRKDTLEALLRMEFADRDKYPFGIPNVVVLPKISILEGIHMVRQLLHVLYIDEVCNYLITCLENYSKEWDEKLGVWKNSPLHNEWSHGADLLRYLALTRSNGLITIHRPTGKPTHSKGSNQVVDGMAM